MEFTVKDKMGNITNGKGHCYITDSSDKCGMPWIQQLPEMSRTAANYKSCKNVEIDSRKGIKKLKEQFEEVFPSGLELRNVIKNKLCLKTDAQPVFRKNRPVPFMDLARLDEEINRLEGEGIITQVDYSKCAAPIVFVKKAKGNIRLCGDCSTGLNDSLLLHQHPLPTSDYIFYKIEWWHTFYSDRPQLRPFADAYLQVEVEENSREMLTINTHHGIFRYNRLPFDLKSVPRIFQQIIDSMIVGLPGVAVYLDDVIVTGRTFEELTANLEILFERILKYGFHVRLVKSNFFMPKIKYLGFCVDEAGRHPDPDFDSSNYRNAGTKKY